MYTRIQCKVCMVKFEPRAIEKSLKKNLQMRTCICTGWLVVSLCRACFVLLLVLGPRLGSKKPQDGRSWLQDGRKMASR